MIDYNSKESGDVLENICIFILCLFKRKVRELSVGLDFELKIKANFFLYCSFAKKIRKIQEFCLAIAFRNFRINLGIFWIILEFPK